VECHLYALTVVFVPHMLNGHVQNVSVSCALVCMTSSTVCWRYFRAAWPPLCTREQLQWDRK